MASPSPRFAPTLSPVILAERRARLKRLEAEVTSLRASIVESEISLGKRYLLRPQVSISEFFSDASCSLTGNCNVFLVSLLSFVGFALLVMGARGYGGVGDHVTTLLKNLGESLSTTPLRPPQVDPLTLLPHLATPLFNASRGGANGAPVHLGGPPGARDCSSAVPTVSITRAAPSKGAPVRGPLPSHYTPLDPPTSPVPVGWVEVTLVDGPPQGAQDWAPGPCYHGEGVAYSTERCPYEGGNQGGDFGTKLFEARGWGGSPHFTGGNGYDVRVVGPSIVWGPTADNRDGTYTTYLRIEDPGEYTVEVHKNTEKGCAFAECDISGSLCPKQGYYHEGWKSCWGEAPGPCARRVATLTFTVAPRPGVMLLRDVPTLPTCPPGSSGTAPGRWVERGVASTTLARPPFFGPWNASKEPAQVPFPYVWQFYDCTLEWMDRGCVRACVAQRQVVTVGFSRERGAMFEIAEFMDEGFEHLKVHSALRLGVPHADGTYGLIHNISHVSTYSAFEADQAWWNVGGAPSLPTPDLPTATPLMAATGATFAKDFGELGLCQGDSRPTAILFAVESLWPAWNTHSSRWRPIAEAFIARLQAACPNATLVHKTANAARISAGALTWQRMYGASRASADAALAAGIPTLDAFVMTQPWVPDGTVLPDGLHSYIQMDSTHPRPDETHTTLGNFVARTISQLFLRQTCPLSCATMEGLRDDDEDDFRRNLRQHN